MNVDSDAESQKFISDSKEDGTAKPTRCGFVYMFFAFLSLASLSIGLFVLEKVPRFGI